MMNQAITSHINEIRKEFPILSREVNNRPLVYFDNAASTQKPKSVINALVNYYTHYNANIHRGVHTLSAEATQQFDNARKRVAKFLGTSNPDNIIFTSGTTASINLVAYSFCETYIKEGDEILISAMEHHSNIVPWQLHLQRKGATLKVIPLNENCALDVLEAEKMISDKTRLIALTHCSNSLGVINPIKKVIDLAHNKNVPILLDGAQAASFIPLEMDNWDVEFYTLSAHKLFGPTGVGVLYGKSKWLDDMVPYMGGGDMIKDVSFEATTYNNLPHKFEAGTPNIADVIATQEAINFIDNLGKDAIFQHETELLTLATAELKKIDGMKIYGDVEDKAPIISFNIDGLHPYDLGQMLDAKGIAIRTGHHCTQPLMTLLGVEGTARISFSIYNTMAEVDYMIDSLNKIIKLLRG